MIVLECSHCGHRLKFDQKHIKEPVGSWKIAPCFYCGVENSKVFVVENDDYILETPLGGRITETMLMHSDLKVLEVFK